MTTVITIDLDGAHDDNQPEPECACGNTYVRWFAPGLVECLACHTIFDLPTTTTTTTTGD